VTESPTFVLHQTHHRTGGTTFWKWWLYMESTNTVLACGDAPTRDDALSKLDAARTTLGAQGVLAFSE
jgi:hypothetical protein